jgi:hypothetical protein
MAIYLADVQIALANLLGEETVSPTWPASRNNAIQWSLERIARYYDFDFGNVTLTKTTTGTGEYVFLSGDGVRRSPELDVRVVNAGPDNDFIFAPVDRNDFDSYGQGSYRYYVSTDASGVQTLVTTEPNTAIQIIASAIAPTISSVTPSNFPSALCVAKGALIYVREQEDKDADTSVEEAKFLQMLEEIMGAEQRSRGVSRAKGIQELTGHYTGEVN